MTDAPDSSDSSGVPDSSGSLPTPPEPPAAPVASEPEGAPSAPPPPLSESAPAFPPSPYDSAPQSTALDRLETLNEGRSVLGAIRDDIEAIAFALVMALLLRHFCIEVFKIPTNSMYPTLYGDDISTVPQTVGDRILLDKMAYLFGGPDRWDVVVFRYPLDKSRNFIKRVAFLPNEEGRIERGDLWVKRKGSSEEFVVARKRRKVREQLYFPVYPPVDSGERARTAFYWRSPAEGGIPFQIASADEFRFPGGPVPDGASEGLPHGALQFGFLITSATHAVTGPTSTTGQPVIDARVRLDVTPESDRCAFEISWKPGDGRTARFRLATEGMARSAAGTRSSEVPLTSLHLAKGRTAEVEMESVDGDVRAWVDGKEVAVVPNDLTLAQVEKMQEEGTKEAQDLRLSAEGGAIRLSHVRVDRDLYYGSNHDDGDNVPRRGESIDLPDDGYFMLGDHTEASSDSRKWRARGTGLRDGTKIWYDSGTSPHGFSEGGRERRTVVDIDGITRTWDSNEEDPASTFLERRISIVTRDLIVGRAFFAMVFWPLTGDSLKRFRFIH